MSIPPPFSPSLVVYDTGSPVSLWNKPFTLDDDSDYDSDVISCHNYHETSSPSIEVGNSDGSQMTLTGPMVQNAFVDQEWLLKFSFLDDNEVTSDDALSCPNYQESPSTLLPASMVWHHFASSGIRRTSIISIEVGNTDGLRVPYAEPTVPYPQHPDAQKPSLVLSSRLSFGELLSFGTISRCMCTLKYRPPSLRKF